MDFDEIYRRLYAYALAHYDPAMASDLTQEAIMVFVAKQDQLDIDDNPLPLLCKMVHDLDTDRKRSKRREEEFLNTAFPDGRGVWPSAADRDALRETELRQGMREAFKGLTATNRSIAWLRICMGMSWHEVGAKVGLSCRAVEARWRRTILPRLQRFFREWPPVVLPFAGVMAWLRSTRERVATAALAVAAGLVISVGTGEIELPLFWRDLPPSQGLDDRAGTPAMEVASAAATRPRHDPADPVPDQSADRTEERVQLPAPPAGDSPDPPAQSTVELTPNPNGPGRQEHDSTRVEIPHGTIVAGGEVYTTGPIGSPVCPTVTEACSATGRAEHGIG